jgi:hypothetical protein
MEIILVLLLPFPLVFISVTGLFVLTYYLRSRNEMKRFGSTGKIGDLFSSFSSVFADQNRSLKYYCMGCGKNIEKLHVLAVVQR